MRGGASSTPPSPCQKLPAFAELPLPPSLISLISKVQMTLYFSDQMTRVCFKLGNIVSGQYLPLGSPYGTDYIVCDFIHLLLDLFKGGRALGALVRNGLYVTANKGSHSSFTTAVEPN